MKTHIKYAVLFGSFFLATLLVYTFILLILPTFPGHDGADHLQVIPASILLGTFTGIISGLSKSRGSFNAVFLGILAGFLGTYLMSRIIESMSRSYAAPIDGAVSMAVTHGPDFSELLGFFELSLVTIISSCAISGYACAAVRKYRRNRK